MIPFLLWSLHSLESAMIKLMRVGGRTLVFLISPLLLLIYGRIQDEMCLNTLSPSV